MEAAGEAGVDAAAADGHFKGHARTGDDAHVGGEAFAGFRGDEGFLIEELKETLLHEGGGMLELVDVEGAAVGGFDVAGLAVGGANVAAGVVGFAKEAFFEEGAAIEAATCDGKRAGGAG